MHLEKLVNELLKTYVGGDKYFDNLDLSIRSNNKFLDCMINKVKEEDFDYIIVSGHYGKTFTNYCKKNNLFKDKIILVQGSIRKGKNIKDKLKFNLDNKKVIFIDDSCYSKKTINEVKKYIEDKKGNFIKTFVYYDGSYNKSNDITSFYRYYDNFELS